MDRTLKLDILSVIIGIPVFLALMVGGMFAINNIKPILEITVPLAYSLAILVTIVLPSIAATWILGQVVLAMFGVEYDRKPTEQKLVKEESK